jgi:hypothetical protein
MLVTRLMRCFLDTGLGNMWEVSTIATESFRDQTRQTATVEIGMVQNRHLLTYTFWFFQLFSSPLDHEPIFSKRWISFSFVLVRSHSSSIGIVCCYNAVGCHSRYMVLLFYLLCSRRLPISWKPLLCLKSQSTWIIHVLYSTYTQMWIEGDNTF